MLFDALDYIAGYTVLNDVSEPGVYQYYGYLPAYQAYDEAAGEEVRRLQPA